MIDFHSHLDLYPRPREHARSLPDDLKFVLSVTNAPSAFRGTKTLEKEHPAVRTAVGLHPQLALSRRGELPLLLDLMADHTFVGEVGLDGQGFDSADREAQIAVFRAVLEAGARYGGRVFSIHSRRAASQVVAEIRAQPNCGIPVLHWFSGSPTELRRAVELGCWFSVGPTMLLSAKGRALATLMPPNRVLTESDGPFAEVRDRPTEPWDVTSAHADLAKCWSLGPGEVEDLLAENLRTLLSSTA